MCAASVLVKGVPDLPIFHMRDRIGGGRQLPELPETWRGQRRLFIKFYGCVCPSSSPILQNFHSLATYLSQCSSTAFLDIVSDFHLLLFLVTNEVMPLRVRRRLTFAPPLLVLICVAEHVPLVTFFCAPQVVTGVWASLGRPRRTDLLSGAVRPSELLFRRQQPERLAELLSSFCRKEASCV